MKILLAFTCFSLLLSLLSNPKNSGDVKKKICKTWVAYEVVTSEPMMQRKTVLKIDKANLDRYDSIQINNDGSYFHFRYSGTYTGNWRMNTDSTELFILPISPTHANRGWIVSHLSDSSMYLKQFDGREGKSKNWKYKPFKEAKN